MHRSILTATVLALAACGNKASDTLEEGIDLFGGDDVGGMLEVIGDEDDGLRGTTDLAFNPDHEGELWTVNRGSDGVVLYFDAGTAQQTSQAIIDPYALHFMEQVSSIAFGAPGTFATCQDSRNTYGGQADGNDFMGPTLWSSDLNIFGVTNPEAVEYVSDLFGFYSDLGSHLDMLHESPECMGIEWSHDNVYWVFDGLHSSINRYDFAVDHGPGYDDHSDGIIGRWVAGEVERVKGVPSHLALDPSSGLLYIADTGNNRIAVLDTNTGERGKDLQSVEPGVDHHKWVDASLTTLVDGASLGMQLPSGLALHEGLLYATDHGTGRLHAFDLAGKELDRAETGLGADAITGIIVSQGALWFTQKGDDSVLRLPL